jgi:hypothetical protein
VNHEKDKPDGKRLLLDAKKQGRGGPQTPSTA